jgi:hypothetical protein
MKFFRILLLFLSVSAFAQQGGMWIPSLLEGMNEKEMKSLGMKMSAKDIYDVNKSSMKDAVPQFNGGCTSEVISSKGLILTNHHCGYGQIQSHSTVENDYLEKGFWAMNLAEELPNPGVVVTFIVKIEDIDLKNYKAFVLHFNEMILNPGKNVRSDFGEVFRRLAKLPIKKVFVCHGVPALEGRFEPD